MKKILAIAFLMLMAISVSVQSATIPIDNEAVEVRIVECRSNDICYISYKLDCEGLTELNIEPRNSDSTYFTYQYIDKDGTAINEPIRVDIQSEIPNGNNGNDNNGGLPIVTIMLGVIFFIIGFIIALYVFARGKK